MPVNGLTPLPYESVNDARSRAMPDGSMIRTKLPSGRVYCVPGARVGTDGKPASSNPYTMRLRLVATTTPSELAMKSGAAEAAPSAATQ